MGAQVRSVGHYQPARVVTNEEISQRIDTNDEWIRTRVGVQTRHLAREDETIDEMGALAGQDALRKAGLTAQDIDLVIVATSTPETPVPNVAASVAGRLGISVGAFDVNTACSGFSYGLANAHHAIIAGTAQRVLLVGAERFSSWLDWNDRSTAVIFGDAAGAAVVEASDTEGIGPVRWGSDGTKAGLIRIPDRHSSFMQEGQSVFRWATSEIAPIALQACEAAGVKPDELAAVVPHQANLRIIDAIARKLGADNAVIARDIVGSGNTSTASIPMALSKMLERKEIPSGSPVLLIGFGAGLTYAGQVIRCP
ncbi:MAG: ketoacyl-ACP synthase III [Corynebacteriales bacterium]|nr:ketoacyl-ACP synthase III [Mycobacteriales bacterium]